MIDWYLNSAYNLLSTTENLGKENLENLYITILISNLLVYILTWLCNFNLIDIVVG